jgi:hypothetical protein
MAALVTYSWCDMVSTDGKINRVLDKRKLVHMRYLQLGVQQEIMRLSDFKQE